MRLSELLQWQKKQEDDDDDDDDDNGGSISWIIHKEEMGIFLAYPFESYKPVRLV